MRDIVVSSRLDILDRCGDVDRHNFSFHVYDRLRELA